MTKSDVGPVDHQLPLLSQRDGGRTVCDLYFIVHFIFHIANCLLCILYRVFLLYPRPTAHFYMYICHILLIQLLG